MSQEEIQIELTEEEVGKILSITQAATIRIPDLTPTEKRIFKSIIAKMYEAQHIFRKERMK